MDCDKVFQHFSATAIDTWAGQTLMWGWLGLTWIINRGHLNNELTPARFVSVKKNKLTSDMVCIALPCHWHTGHHILVLSRSKSYASARWVVTHSISLLILLFASECAVLQNFVGKHYRGNYCVQCRRGLLVAVKSIDQILQSVVLHSSLSACSLLLKLTHWEW
jgi:hypothetical protein